MFNPNILMDMNERISEIKLKMEVGNADKISMMEEKELKLRLEMSEKPKDVCL